MASELSTTVYTVYTTPPPLKWHFQRAFYEKSMQTCFGGPFDQTIVKKFQKSHFYELFFKISNFSKLGKLLKTIKYG